MKAAGLTIGPTTYLDHLGVLCEVLDIPLLVSEDALLNAAGRFYPNLCVEKRDLSALSSPALLEEFDMLFYTSKVWACESYVFARELYGASTRIVYCPHGNSDKGHTLFHEPNYPATDIELYYGEHMHSLLKEMGALEATNHFVRIGNFRYDYYQKNKSFLDLLAEEHIFSRFKEEKETILYAPTWHTDECPSSFFSSCTTLIENLPDRYNLIIKLHPFLERDEPVLTHRLLGQFRNHDSLLFIEEFPPIYPILSRCALYLGDFSSIGYDFLTFDRPLFFFDPLAEKTRSHTLHKCGLAIPHQTNPFAFIKKNLDLSQKSLSAERKKMYAYTFGKPISFKRPLQAQLKQKSLADWALDSTLTQL